FPLSGLGYTPESVPGVRVVQYQGDLGFVSIHAALAAWAPRAAGYSLGCRSSPLDAASRAGLCRPHRHPWQAGGFCCAPSWMDAPQRWPAEWPQRSWGAYWTVEPDDDEILEVPTRAGDVVMFESRLPHGTV